MKSLRLFIKYGNMFLINDIRDGSQLFFLFVLKSLMITVIRRTLCDFFYFEQRFSPRGAWFVARRCGPQGPYSCLLSLLPLFFYFFPALQRSGSFFFANKPRAHFWQDNVRCQLVRDIVPPRCEMSFFFRGSSLYATYLYPSLLP